MQKIQIQPKLTRYKTLIKYLKLIDKNKYYSNFGPLYHHSKKELKKI